MFSDSLGFSTYNDFYKRREQIKKEFRRMKGKELSIYRMYLYSKREISTNKVDLIWEYLNEPDTSVLCPKDEQLRQYFNKELDELEKRRMESEYIEY